MEHTTDKREGDELDLELERQRERISDLLLLPTMDRTLAAIKDFKHQLQTTEVNDPLELANTILDIHFAALSRAEKEVLQFYILAETSRIIEDDIFQWQEAGLVINQIIEHYDDLVRYYSALYTPGGVITISSLKALLSDMKGKLDAMNELSEMTSLRLQMTMDRRSKFIATLSNMMKKIATTQDLLIQNIK